MLRFPEVAGGCLPGTKKVVCPVKKGVNSPAPNNSLLCGWVLIGKRMRRIRIRAICLGKPAEIKKPF